MCATLLAGTACGEDPAASSIDATTDGLAADISPADAESVDGVDPMEEDAVGLPDDSAESLDDDMYSASDASTDVGDDTGSDVEESDAQAAPPLPPGVCQTWGKAAAKGTLDHADLSEISGFAESVLHPDVLWAHNDSGDSARLLALNHDASIRAIVHLKGAKARDWEDMALGPCAAGDDPASWGCLYIGDVGDNALKYKTSMLLRVNEPVSLPPAATAVAQVDLTPLNWRSWNLKWPHGPRDVEALAALPDARLILLTKEQKKGLSEVYRVVLGDATAASATRLGVVATALPDVLDGLGVMVTAADSTVDGSRLLVRTYLRMFLFDVGDALTLPPDQAGKALATAKRIEVPFAWEIQGEAVAWSRSGGYWHASEKFKGVVPKLHRVACVP